MAAIAIPSRYDQAEIVATIKQTVAKGATDAQLRMFLEVCKRTGLDPFLKEVWYVPEKGIIMAGRDGYLRVANENPQFDGMETRVERDDRGLPIKATCSVWRKDRTHAITCEAFYSEYCKQSPVWKQYPSAMISKVAEVLALKRSFSINGVVSEEEIGFDGRGSAEAAREVADAKLAELRKGPQPVAQIVEDLPEVQDEDRGEEIEQPQTEDTLEDQLRQSIIDAEMRRGRKPAASYFEMLGAFQHLKGRYQAIGFERAYYAILGQFGYRHSNDFPQSDEGLSDARMCYKSMSLDVANREARRAKGVA